MKGGAIMSNRRLLLSLNNGIIADGNWHRLYDFIYCDNVENSYGEDRNIFMYLIVLTSEVSRNDVLKINSNDIQFGYNKNVYSGKEPSLQYQGYYSGGALMYRFNGDGSVNKTEEFRERPVVYHDGIYKKDLDTTVDSNPRVNVFLIQFSNSGVGTLFGIKMPVVYNTTKNIEYIPMYRTGDPQTSEKNVAEISYFYNGQQCGYLNTGFRGLDDSGEANGVAFNGDILYNQR